MGIGRHTAEQIISKLWEAEVLQGKRMGLEETLRQFGISDAIEGAGAGEQPR